MSDIRNAAKVTKSIIKIINGFGCDIVASGIISNALPQLGLIKKVCVNITSLCIGTTMADITNNYTCKKIDSIVDAYENGNLANVILGMDKNDAKYEEET